MKFSACLLKLYVVCFSALDCLLVAGHLRTVQNCGIRNVARIVGGSAAQNGEYPWMVSIDFQGHTNWCGGTIVNENWIVTSAHCIMIDDPRDYEIHAGINQLSNKNVPSWRKYQVDRIIVHENYNKESKINAIALMHTKSPMDFQSTGGFVNAVCLPSTAEDPSGTATVIGWGMTQYGSRKISDILKTVDVNLVPRTTCAKAFKDLEGKPGYKGIKSSMICAGGESENICKGDYGSPLLQTDEKGVSTLIGIASHGRSCGRGNTPAVYTKVGSYLDWLEKNMG